MEIDVLVGLFACVTSSGPTRTSGSIFRVLLFRRANGSCCVSPAEARENVNVETSGHLGKDRERIGLTSFNDLSRDRDGNQSFVVMGTGEWALRAQIF